MTATAPPAFSPAVYLETFGCQMNVLDSQLITSHLQSLNYHFVGDWRQADVVLYNTCSVRQAAEQKVLSRLGQLRLRKLENPHVVVGVVGCMAEQAGVKLLRKYPQVDLLCGPGELHKLSLLIGDALRNASAAERLPAAHRAALRNRTRSQATSDAAEDPLEVLDLGRRIQPFGHSGAAYVRITRGCNKFCSYCVVPFTRGPEVHRPPQSIIDECKRLVDSGVVEITLLGQTVNHYHFDHGAAVSVAGIPQPQLGSVVRPGGNGSTAHTDPSGSRRVTTFAELLVAIHQAVPALRRLRFVTSFPRDFGDDILDAISACPRICRYFHLPVQTGSDRLLALMNRGYTVASYLNLIQRIRERLPGATWATDIICGFPTETEEDHQATAALLRAVRCKNAFIFKYSPRPGTAAAQRYADDVPDAIKRRRNNQLLALQNHISAEIHNGYIGSTPPVFVESISPAGLRAAGPGGPLGAEPGRLVQLTGRTDGDLIVCFPGQRSLIGKIQQIRITRAGPLTLFGELAGATP